MKEKKKKTFDLVSSNEEVNSVLNNMKSNSKVYLKLITGLQLLGNFEGKTEIDFYDKIDKSEIKPVDSVLIDQFKPKEIADQYLRVYNGKVSV